MTNTLNCHALALKEADTLTISSGVITATQEYHVIAAETGTTDTVDTISLGYTNLSVKGNTYRPCLRLIADSGDTITLAHGTGNLVLPDGSDITLNDDAFVWLLWRGSAWYAMGTVASGGGTTADVVTVDVISTPTYTTVQDLIDIVLSAGYISGGGLTDNGDGTIDVAAGTGLIRISNSSTASLRPFDWSASAGISLTDGQSNYVYLDYNAGSPQIAVTTSGSTIRDNERDKFELYEIVREGTALHTTDHRQIAGDALRQIQRRLYEIKRIERADGEGGLIISETGTRNIAVTAGKLWVKLVDESINAIDTSGADTFDRYYRDGVGGWTKTTGNTQWDNTYYDNNAGSPTELTAARYSCQYFYLDSDGDLVSLYGQAQYTTYAQVLEDTPPASVPTRIEEHAMLIGRVVFQKSDTSAQAVQSVFTTVFSASQVTDHGSLAGLADNDHPQYNVEGVKIYWLGKHGNDSNSGLTWNDAVLTIGQAHTLTAAQSPATGNRFAIVCLDGGIYDEDVTCQSYVNLIMPSATITGTITGAAYCSTKVHRVVPDTSTNAFQLSSGTGWWHVVVDWVDLGNNTTGFYQNSSASYIIAYIGWMRVLSGSSGTVGLHVDLGTMDIDYGYLNTDTFYDVAIGTTLHIMGRNNPTGTRTGTAYEINPTTFKVFSMTLSGYTITGISNDTTLAGDATDELVTEHAVKDYVDGVYGAYIEDQKPQNTAGGTFTAGTRTRDLNTKVRDLFMICSIEKLEISSGGTYVIAIGDVIEGDTSGTTATVWALENTAGSFAGGDWEGYLWLEDDATGAFTPTETLHVGANPNVATVDADATNNQVRLKAGWGMFDASAPCRRGELHQTLIYDVTNSAEIKRGTSEYSESSSGYATTRSFVETDWIELSSDTTYELRHYCSVTAATNGFGGVVNQGTEVYSQMKVYWRAS